LATRQRVGIAYNETGVTQVKTFGAKMPSGTVNLDESAPDFFAYEGDVDTRKFPYDRA
jgi:primary-amine oxidase